MGLVAVDMDAVYAVDFGSLGDAGEDGVLAASAGGDEFLAADGGVVDDGGGVDVVDCALAGLVVAGEAPGVGLSVFGDGEVVVGASSDSDGAGYVWGS